MLPFEVHMLSLSARRIFSEFEFIINASGALWIMLRWPLMILLCCVVKSTGALSVNAQGNDGFWQTANWNGENPCTLWKVFLASRHQDGQYQEYSGFLLATCWASLTALTCVVQLFHSIKEIQLMLLRDSVHVVIQLILLYWQLHTVLIFFC